MLETVRIIDLEERRVSNVVRQRGVVGLKFKFFNDATIMMQFVSDKKTGLLRIHSQIDVLLLFSRKYRSTNYYLNEKSNMKLKSVS